MDAKKLREMMQDEKMMAALSRSLEVLKSPEAQEALNVLVEEAEAAGREAGVGDLFREAIATSSFSAMMYDISRAPLVELLDRARQALEQLTTVPTDRPALGELGIEVSKMYERDARSAIAAITKEIGEAPPLPDPSTLGAQLKKWRWLTEDETSQFPGTKWWIHDCPGDGSDGKLQPFTLPGRITRCHECGGGRGEVPPA